MTLEQMHVRDLPDPRSDVVESLRPWGDFRQFAHNKMTTVKVISVLPGQRLSLQRHEQRAELWIVLDGALQVTVDDREWSAQRDELVWVPCGARHRMGNPGDTAVRVLEVAFGLFDEQDIERLEDDYARH